MATNAIAGCDTKVYLNGVMFGYIMGMPQYTILTQYVPLNEIDSNQTRELAPGASSVQGAFVVLRGRDTGGLEGAGLVSSGRKMLAQKYLTIELVDRVTDQTIFRATGCQITSQTWSIQPKGLVTGQFAWSGISHENEAMG